MSGFTILRRRSSPTFRYSLTYVDSSNVAILEIDGGHPRDTSAKREPTRRLCVVNAAHIEELQDECDKWNKANADRLAEWPETVLINHPED